MNTGSQKHVIKTLKNAEKKSHAVPVLGDLIPSNMQSWHAPKEPQQLRSEIFSVLLKHQLLASKWFCLWILAIPLGTCEKAPVNTGSQKHVAKTLKNAKKIPVPVSGDLIPATCNLGMRQRSHNSQDLRFFLHSSFA